MGAVFCVGRFVAEDVTAVAKDVSGVVKTVTVVVILWPAPNTL